MDSILKWAAGILGLICLALFFPFVRTVYQTVDGNGTGVLHMAGTTVNNNFIQFLPVLVPVMIFVIVLIYVIRKDSGQGQPK